MRGRKLAQGAFSRPELVCLKWHCGGCARRIYIDEFEGVVSIEERVPML